MHFELSSEQQMLVETVRRFVEAELYPHEKMVEETDSVPDELAAEIRTKSQALGLYAVNMPAELGGVVPFRAGEAIEWTLELPAR